MSGFFFGRPPFAPFARAAASFSADVDFPPFFPPLAPDLQEKWVAGCIVSQIGQRYFMQSFNDN
jgi:hypothetical protein